MTKMYLKYYFGHDGNSKFFFDSVAVVENKKAEEPKDFLKWYEHGDFVDSNQADENEKLISESQSPAFWKMFSPKEVTFSVNDLLEKRSKSKKYFVGWQEFYNPRPNWFQWLKYKLLCRWFGHTWNKKITGASACKICGYCSEQLN